ncbi:MAG TPA: phytanoyl-CoA dioxygenase family protein, partial [Thermoanaerobaculia bacterium]|nr:phytanoyl-CoA dioxygenase family protein [Thermoanaerobaculia bacterium]
PRVFPLVRELLGPDLMMLDHDYFITPPGAAIPQGWHFDFDLPGVDHPRSRLAVKAFYVLEDIPPDGGATLLLPGSHLAPGGARLPNSEVPEELPGAVPMALPAGSAYLINDRLYHSAGNNRSRVHRRLLIYTYGHKWMRMWDEYRPSPELAARAATPGRRQLLGLSDPYAPPVDWEGAADSAASAATLGAPPAPPLAPVVAATPVVPAGPVAPASPSAPPVPAAMTAEQRRFFAANGYLVLPGVLPSAELAAVRRAADEAEARWRGDPGLPGTRIPEFLEIAAIMEYGKLLFDLAEHPGIFPLVREALGPDVALIDHAYYITPPGGRIDGTAWHTDVRTRLRGVHHAGSTMMVRAMIALTDIAPDGGATLVLPGSHLQPDGSAIPAPATPEEVPGAVPLACTAGSAYFFNGNLLHAPANNRGTVTRRVLLYNYGHKWMRMWREHEPSPRLAAAARTPMRRQLLGLTPPYRGPDAELSVGSLGVD